MPSYNSISAALAAAQKKIQKAINKALEEDVAEEIRDAEVAAIGRVVYDAYGNKITKEPNDYVRRYDNGGLADRNNMKAEVSNGELSVWNITPANTGYPPDYGEDGYLAGEIVLNGGPYHWPKGANTFGDFHPPRDFIAETYTTLRQTKWHVNGLKRGLQKQGIDVE
jgi:hypothetical protein